MCDDAKLQEAVANGAVDATIRSEVEKKIENSDQMNEALYKKGCGLMKTVFEENKKKYSKEISGILEKNIPELFKDGDFKASLTSTLVEIMKKLDYRNYIVEVKGKTGGGSKTLHNKTFKKPRKGNKRKKQNK
jgi:hypothetical protein